MSREQGWELSGRAALVAFFAVFATIRVLEIRSLAEQWQEYPTPYIDLAAHLSGLAFLILVLGATIFRLAPVKSAGGWEPKISAFIGSFLTLAIGALPQVEMGAAWRVMAISVTIIGWLASFWVLRWLGRSFSITAQSRQLVTSGPYAVVRHPLYLAEEITVFGVMFLSFSWLAVFIVVVQWIFQLRRMGHEEQILRNTFPAYAAYEAQTPKIIPWLAGVGARKRLF